MTITLAILDHTLPDHGLDLTGKRFISERHANPVVWIVKHYHRCDGWVCEEQEHKTTCEFSTQEILNWEVKD